MKKILTLLVSLFLSTPGVAGFAEGEEAFNQQHYTQAFSEFLPIANQGDFRSQYYIGYLYLYGYGVPQNPKEATRYLQKAVDQNYDMAQSLMAFLYSEGKVLPQDKKKALTLYQKASEQNNISAHLNLGVMYYTGDGVERDYEMALKYFQKVPIEEKSIVSRYLGEIYLNNSSLRDYDKAIKYYKISAQQGDLGSFYTLGEIYRKGLGVSTDMTEALKYYKFAATQNYAPAQYMLGIIYANGEEVTRDIYKAYAWLSLAVEQKLIVAEKALSKLSENMSLTDFDSARRQIILIHQNEMGKIESPLLPEKIVNAQNTEQPQRTARRRTLRRRHK